MVHYPEGMCGVGPRVEVWSLKPVLERQAAHVVDHRAVSSTGGSTVLLNTNTRHALAGE